MTDKELKKMRKPEMLRLLLRQQREIDRLNEELQKTKERLSEKRLSIQKAGSIAEAAVELNGIFERAQEAADQYLMNVKEMAGASAQAGDASDASENARSVSGGDGAGDAEDEDGKEEEAEPEPLSAASGAAGASGGTDAADFPTVAQLEDMVRKMRYRNRYMWALRSTIYALVTVAATATLIAVLIMPVLQIYGSSMNPTLYEGNIVISLKGSEMATGDIVAFYYNNNVLVKRVIGQPGQWIDIAEDGTVYVDNVAVDEPYLTDRAFGECDIELPYQVPESRVFVMGDNRSVSIDSRSRTVGCVAEEQLVGKIVFRIWPLNQFGKV